MIKMVNFMLCAFYRILKDSLKTPLLNKFCPVYPAPHPEDLQV